MTLAQVLEGQFRGDIRFRGAAYLKAERVAITRVTPETIFAVVTDGTDSMHLAGAECCEVIHDGPRRTRAASNGNHLMCHAACFQTRFRQFRIDFQILIEKKIAQHGNPPLGKLI